MITIDYKQFMRDRGCSLFGYRFEYASARMPAWSGHWRLYWSGGVTPISFAIAEWLQERMDQWV